jgi:hypothetical protein
MTPDFGAFGLKNCPGRQGGAFSNGFPAFVRPASRPSSICQAFFNHLLPTSSFQSDLELGHLTCSLLILAFTEYGPTWFLHASTSREGARNSTPSIASNVLAAGKTMQHSTLPLQLSSRPMQQDRLTACRPGFAGDWVAALRRIQQAIAANYRDTIDYLPNHPAQASRASTR